MLEKAVSSGKHLVSCGSANRMLREGESCTQSQEVPKPGPSLLLL